VDAREVDEVVAGRWRDGESEGEESSSNRTCGRGVGANRSSSISRSSKRSGIGESGKGREKYLKVLTRVSK